MTVWLDIFFLLSVADYLYYLLRNETAYQEYFLWRQNFLVESYYSLPDTCEVCQKLHSIKGEEFIQRNMTKWFHDDADCVWTL